MTQSRTEELLKQAILLERRGMQFYRKVAEQTENEKVKDFFNFMADEEKEHIAVLGKQFKAYQATGSFKKDLFDDTTTSQAGLEILDKKTRARISAASFEAASIGAAILMEKRAVDLYSKGAAAATDPEEKKLYAWLSAWEREHLNMLMEIDRQLTEDIWHDNSFWPF